MIQPSALSMIAFPLLHHLNISTSGGGIKRSRNHQWIPAFFYSINDSLTGSTGFILASYKVISPEGGFGSLE
jgi:hypothetical protein